MLQTVLQHLRNALTLRDNGDKLEDLSEDSNNFIEAAYKLMRDHENDKPFLIDLSACELSVIYRDEEGNFFFASDEPPEFTDLDEVFIEYLCRFEFDYGFRAHIDSNIMSDFQCNQELFDEISELGFDIGYFIGKPNANVFVTPLSTDF